LPLDVVSCDTMTPGGVLKCIVACISPTEANDGAHARVCHPWLLIMCYCARTVTHPSLLSNAKPGAVRGQRNMLPCIFLGRAAKAIVLSQSVSACYIGANVIPTGPTSQALSNCQLADAQPVNEVSSQGFIMCHKARSIMLLHHGWT